MSKCSQVDFIQIEQRSFKWPGVGIAVKQFAKQNSEMVASFYGFASCGRFQVRRCRTYNSCSAPLQSTRSQARRRRRRSCRETAVVGGSASNQGSRRQCRANPRWLLLLVLVLVLVPVLVLLCAFDRRAALCLASSREPSPLVSGMACGGFKIGFSPLQRSCSCAAAKWR